MEYFLFLLAFLVSGLILEWRFHFHLYKTMKERLLITGIMFGISIIWDWFAIYRGHWMYPGAGMLGIQFLGVPIEDILFGLIMPYWAITIYKLFHEKLKVR